MTLPRQFLPNTTYFITRRTTQREFWLKPTKKNTQIFLYCIAIAAQKTGVRLNAACVMSNHWHAVISDPEERIAQFYAWVHKYVAKAMNCSRGRWENLWSSEKTSVIPLESAEDIQSKIVYCLINPVNAHLTAKASRWQGVWLCKQSHSRTVKRPDKYFQRDGTMPETAELRIHVPMSRENMRVAAYEKLIEEQLSAQENEIAEAMRKSRQTFMGMGAVLKQSYTARPQSTEERRGMNPRFFSLEKKLRINAIRRYKFFVSQYCGEQGGRGTRGT
ncbi:MAG: transposase [Deltaproteobacteria bacterium]|nr:transposase [Deltaproteobacteria bacterium]